VSSCKRGTSSSSRELKTIREDGWRTRAPSHSHEVISLFFFSSSGSGSFLGFSFLLSISNEVSNHSAAVVAIVGVLTLSSELGLLLSLGLGSRLDLEHSVVGNGSVVQHLFDLLGVTPTLSRQFSEKCLEEEGNIVGALSVIEDVGHLLSKFHIVLLGHQLTGLSLNVASEDGLHIIVDGLVLLLLLNLLVALARIVGSFSLLLLLHLASFLLSHRDNLLFLGGIFGLLGSSSISGLHFLSLFITIRFV